MAWQRWLQAILCHMSIFELYVLLQIPVDNVNVSHVRYAFFENCSFLLCSCMCDLILFTMFIYLNLYNYILLYSLTRFCFFSYIPSKNSAKAPQRGRPTWARRPSRRVSRAVVALASPASRMVRTRRPPATNASRRWCLMSILDAKFPGISWIGIMKVYIYIQYMYTPINHFQGKMDEQKNEKTVDLDILDRNVYGKSVTSHIFLISQELDIRMSWERGFPAFSKNTLPFQGNNYSPYEFISRPRDTQHNFGHCGQTNVSRMEQEWLYNMDIYMDCRGWYFGGSWGSRTSSNQSSWIDWMRSVDVGGMEC